MKITEYRGVEGLVYAEVLNDDNTAEGGYKTGPVKPLAGIAELSRETDTNSEAKYYDNVPAMVINSENVDTVNCNVSAIPLDTLAEITGQYYDDTTGAMIEGAREEKYYALGYKTKKTDGSEVYVWRLKGTFGIPSSTHVTEDNGTTSNGQTLTYTGISTTHKFKKTNKTAKAINVDLSKDLADTTDFFSTVVTPDTLKVKT